MERVLVGMNNQIEVEVCWSEWYLGAPIAPMEMTSSSWLVIWTVGTSVLDAVTSFASTMQRLRASAPSAWN
jgi:hypothetical protein